MNRISKASALLLTIIITLSCMALLTVKPTNAESVPTPSVPDFSLKAVDASYDVPTTHSIDPYTGQDITHQGYHVSKTNLVMTIQNQPSVYQYNGSFLYNVRVKGHYQENWTQLYLNDQIPLADASSAQTVLIMGSLDGNSLALIGTSTVIPYRGMEDFQVQAMIGGFFKAGLFGHTEFSGESSDWSDTQTLTVGESVSSVLTPSPTLPELPWLVIVPLLLSVFALAVVLRHRKIAISSR